MRCDAQPHSPAVAAHPDSCKERGTYVRNALRVTSLITLVAFILATITVGPFPFTEKVLAQTEAEPDDLPTEREEIEELRDEYSKTFINPDGSYTKETTTEPIHFQNDAEKWVEIDSTLVPCEDPASDCGWENKRGPLDIEFAGRGSWSELLSVERGDKSFAFLNPGTSGQEPVVEENRITYRNIFPTVDLVFEARSNGVKELIVLNVPPRRQPSVSFPLNFDGLTARQTPMGAIELINAAGEVVFDMPKLWMYDSSFDPDSGEAAMSEGVNMTLETRNQRQYVTVTADFAWLTDPARVYPVIVDPTTEDTLTPSLDTFIQSNIYNTPQSTADQLKAGTYDSGTTVARSAFKFNVSSLRGKTITKATFEPFENWSWSCTATGVEVHRILNWWGADVTWHHQNAPQFGALLDEKSAAYGHTNCPDGGRISFNVTQAVTKWLDESGDGWENYGLGLKASNENDNYGWKKFASDDAAHKPWLVVTYTDVNQPPGLPTNLSPAAGALDGDTRPTFQGTYHDPDSWDGGKIEFRVWQEGTPRLDAPIHRGSFAEPGEVSTWRPSVSEALTPTKTYLWEARGWDHKDPSDWTAQRRYTVKDDFVIIGDPSCPDRQKRSLRINWTTTRPSDSKVEYGTTEGTYPFTTSDTTMTADHSVALTDLEPGKTYYFKVSSTTSYGSTASKPWRCDTLPGFLITGGPSDHDRTETSATIDWTTNEPSDSKAAYGLSPAYTDSTPTQTPLVENHSVVLQNLAPEKTYFYKVISRNSEGEIREAEGQFQTLPRLRITAGPTGSDVDYESATINWTTSEASSSHVDYGLVAGLYTDQADAPGNAAEHRVPLTDLDPSTTYYYRVSSTTPDGRSVTKTESFTTAPPPPDTLPDRPQVSSTTHSDPNSWYRNRNIEFTWPTPASVAPIQGYSYVFNTNEGTEPDTKIDALDGPNLKHYQNHAPQGQLWFHVRAKNRYGWGATGHFPIKLDYTANPPTAVASTSHIQGVSFAQREMRMQWTPANDESSGVEETSGVAGYYWVFRGPGCGGGTQCPQGAPADPNDPSTNENAVDDPDPTQASSNSETSDGRYYFHVRTVDVAGNLSPEVVRGPYIVDQANGTIVPLNPSLDRELVAQSDRNGLEQFYPYRSMDLGTASAYTHLYTGNLVVQESDVMVPGWGLNAVIKHTYNSMRSERNEALLQVNASVEAPLPTGNRYDTGLGEGWSLSLADLDSDIGAITDIDVNSPLIPTGADVVGAVNEAAGRVLELTDGDGTNHRFVRRGGPNTLWDSPPGVNLQVRERDLNAVGFAQTYELVRPDGVRYIAKRLYCPEGPPLADAITCDVSKNDPSRPVAGTWHVVAIKDRNDNQLSLEYERFEDATSLSKMRVVGVRHNSDPGKQMARFAYDAQGRLGDIYSLPGVTAPDPATGTSRSYERRTTFDYTGGRLSSVTENAHASSSFGKRVTTYAYSTMPGEAAPTLLTAFTRGAAVHRFGYQKSDGAWLAKNYVDAETGEWSFAFGAKNPNNGERTTTMTSPRAETHFLVSGRNPISQQDARLAGNNIEEITDAGNNSGPTKTTYDWYANLLRKETDGLGHQKQIFYNELGLVTKVIQPPTNDDRGDLHPEAPKGSVTTTFDYNFPDEPISNDCVEPVPASGHCHAIAELTKVVAGAGLADSRTTRFDYDGPNLSTITSEGKGDPDRTTTFTYYDFGGLRRVNGPRTDVVDVTIFGDESDSVTHGYHPSGFPLRVEDAKHQMKLFEYTPYGEVGKMTDRASRVFRSRYDERGNLVESIDPSGRSTFLTYTGLDLVFRKTTPRGVQTTFIYNKNGQLIEHERPGREIGDVNRWSTFYYEDGLVMSQRSPFGTEIAYDYYNNGQLHSTKAPGATSESPAVTEYLYNKAGQVKEEKLPVSTAGGAQPRREIEYTPQGQPSVVRATSATGALDRVTKYSYNAHRQVIETLGPRREYSNNTGMLEAQRNVYDSYGQLKTMRRLVATDPNLRWLDFTYLYDEAGNLVESIQPTAEAQQLKATYKFDNLNRLEKQTQDPFNPGHTVVFDYLPEGQQETRTDTNAGSPVRTVVHTYNTDYSVRSIVSTKNGKTVAQCNWSEGGNPSDGYDDDGNLLWVRTAVGTAGCASDTVRSQHFAYEARGWVRSIDQKIDLPGLDPVTRSQQLTYRDDGAVETSTWDGRTTTYGHTPAGSMSSATPWQAQSQVTADYLPSGAPADIHLGPAITGTFGYHADGSLARLAWTGAASSQIRTHSDIDYDVGGLKIAEQVQIARVTEDVSGTAASSRDTGGGASFNYDLAGRLTNWTSPFAALPNGLLSSGTGTGVVATPNQGDKASTHYTLDDGGNITRSVTNSRDGNQNIVFTRAMTSSFDHGRLDVLKTSETSGNASTHSTARFCYTPLGQENRRVSRTQQNATLPATCTGSPGDVVSDSSYDAADNTDAVDRSGLTDTDVDYVYDASGQLLARTETATGKAPETTLYFYWSGGSTLAEETNETGATRVRYFTSDAGQAIAQEAGNAPGEGAPPAGTWHWLLSDPEGNVATHVRADGTITQQAAYDPYGKLDKGVYKQNGSKSTLGFQSSPTDDVTENLLLGPRIYDPGTDRFTTADSVVAGGTDMALGTNSLTGNRYLFAAANPVAYYENGYMPMCDGYYCGSKGTSAPRKETSSPLSRETLQANVNSQPRFDTVALGSFSYTYDRSKVRPTSPSAPDNNPVINFILEATGVADVERCLQGEAGSCAWAVIGIIPVTRVGKLLKVTSLATSAADGARLASHLRMAEQYGAGGVRELADGRFRYYGLLRPANKAGFMAGGRLAYEWNPTLGTTRAWYETLDHLGNIRQVHPNGSPFHYMFEQSGAYSGKW